MSTAKIVYFQPEKFQDTIDILDLINKNYLCTIIIFIEVYMTDYIKWMHKKIVVSTLHELFMSQPIY